MQHYTDQGFMTMWQDSILSSVKTHACEHTCDLQKKHLKDPSTITPFPPRQFQSSIIVSKK